MNPSEAVPTAQEYREAAEMCSHDTDPHYENRTGPDEFLNLVRLLTYAARLQEKADQWGATIDLLTHDATLLALRDQAAELREQVATLERQIAAVRDLCANNWRMYREEVLRALDAPAQREAR